MCLADCQQDTINAIEGLTEYSLLIKRLRLNMNINVSYKRKGDFYHYRMTEKNFIGRPLEVNEGLFIIFYNWMGALKSSVPPLFYRCTYPLLQHRMSACCVLSWGARYVSGTGH